MPEFDFRPLNPEALKDVPVEDILNPHNPELEEAEYDVPVPTQEQQVIQRRGVRPLHGPELGQYRGRIGGC